MRPWLRPLVWLFLCTCSTGAAAERFQVIFCADMQYASDQAWIAGIKRWGATAVDLRVYRSQVETAYHQDEWGFVRNCIARLAQNDLDITVRLSLVFIPPAYVARYSTDDLHQTRGGQIYYNHLAADQRPMLNLTSRRAWDDLVGFVRRAVRALRSMPGSQRIRFVIPTLSPDDETEFPSQRWGSAGWGWMTGYSLPERTAFIHFLRERYNGDTTRSDPARLNAAWHAAFPAISLASIDINDFDWERLRDSYRSYPDGRKDFIDFRTSQLKRFIDTCARAIHDGGFRCGVQFGSLYDTGIVLRGFYDATSLVEQADLLITSDVVEYAPNFAFVADYERSLGRYWDWRHGRSGARTMGFATTTNWPGYRNIPAAPLVGLWKEQLDTWYRRGASAMFIAHWGTVDGVVRWSTGHRTDEIRIADLVRSDSLDNNDNRVSSRAYREWRTALVHAAGSRRLSLRPATAVHLSCEAILYPRLGDAQSAGARIGRRAVGTIRTFEGDRSGTLETYEFPLASLVRPGAPAAPAPRYSGIQDIITNAMITGAPSFVRQYREIVLTASSYYMPEEAITALTGTATRPPRVRSQANWGKGIAADSLVGARTERNAPRHRGRPLRLVR